MKYAAQKDQLLKVKLPMMKLLLAGFVCLGFFTVQGSAQGDKNYEITVDGKDYEIGIDGTLTAKSAKGDDVVVTLKRKEFATFSGGEFSFEHRSDLSVAASDLDKHLHQYMLASAIGTLIIVQKYDTISPISLTELMMKQLTDDDVKAGSKLAKEKYTITLADGAKMNGLRGHLTNKSDDVDLVIVSADKGDGGIIAITRFNKEVAADEQPIIDRFWKTLKIN